MNKTRPIILFVSVLLLSLGTSAFAKYYDTKPFEYLGPRQMAMGGAGVALLNGAETVYTNPAGLVASGGHLNIPLLLPFVQYNVLAVGDDTVTNLSDLMDAYRESGDDAAASAKMFANLVPKKYSMGGSTIFGYSGENFIPYTGSQLFIGGYTRAWGSFSLLNPVSPRIEYNLRLDTTFGVGAAQKYLDSALWFKNICVGFNFKHLNRISSYDVDKGGETPYITVADILNDDVTFQTYDITGYALDVGVLSDIHTDWGPGKVGLVVNNIFGYLDGRSFNISSENTGVDGNVHMKVPTTVKVGVSLKPLAVSGNESSYFKDLVVAADYDLVYPSPSYLKRLHLGLEHPILADWLKLQVGLNQGYGTMGLSIDTVYKFSLAYYTEEWGREIGQDPHSFWVCTSGFMF